MALYGQTCQLLSLNNNLCCKRGFSEYTIQQKKLLLDVTFLTNMSFKLDNLIRTFILFTTLSYIWNVYNIIHGLKLDISASHGIIVIWKSLIQIENYWAFCVDFFINHQYLPQSYGQLLISEHEPFLMMIPLSVDSQNTLKACLGKRMMVKFWSRGFDFSHVLNLMRDYVI